jgi:hypothetical protein
MRSFVWFWKRCGARAGRQECNNGTKTADRPDSRGRWRRLKTRAEFNIFKQWII